MSIEKWKLLRKIDCLIDIGFEDHRGRFLLSFFFFHYGKHLRMLSACGEKPINKKEQMHRREEAKAK